MLSFEEAACLMDEIAEGFPPAFFETLNGGILFLPEEKLDPDVPGELYVMGEYCHNALGRYINLYYGSFQKVYPTLDREGLKKELFRTLAHEFTHHLESLAGERSLEKKDEQDLLEYLKQFRT